VALMQLRQLLLAVLVLLVVVHSLGLHGQCADGGVEVGAGM
jgi:hypothetical protein